MPPTPSITILVIDDAPEILAGTVRLLTAAGYTVLTAATGADGLRLAQEDHPDLILLDVVLPDGDGRELCRQMKDDPRLQHTFIILLTNVKTSTDDQAEGLEDGADGYIARPITNRELLARVAAFARIKRAEDALRERHQSDKTALLHDLQVHQAELEAQNMELRATQEQLTAARDQYSDFYNFAPLGYLTLDATGCLIKVNLTFTHLLGDLGRRHLLGQKLTQYIARESQDAFHFFWLRLQQSTEAQTAELLLTKADGTTCWTRLDAIVTRTTHADESPEPREYHLTVSDITLRKQAEEALCESEQHYRLLADNIVDFVSTTDLNSRITYISPSVEKALGYSFTELQSLPRDVYMTPASIAYIDQIMAEEMVKEFDDGADPNRYRTLEIEYICRDGRRLICELKSKALRDIHGMPIGVQTTGRDITERKRMAQALERSRDELRSLTQRLTTVVEAERQRIARELHDQMGQNLAVLGVTLKTIQALLPQEMPVDVRLHCEMIAQLIREMGNRLREVILDLRPPILDEYGLLPTLQWAVQQLRQQTGITVEFMTLGEPVPLAADFELAMFRIMQEAIANILKHARATTIFITLEFARDATCLTIADDGIGFDIDALAEGTVLESIHLGLLTMQERAGNIGASCRIDSHPDAGTRVIVTLPGGKHGD